MAVLRDKVVLGTFVGASLVFGAIALLGFLYLGRLDDQALQVQHTLRVITTLERVMSEIKDLETGQRGYVISGDPEFLEPYEDSLTSVEGHLKELQALTRDDPRQQERMQELVPLVEAKLDWTVGSVALYRAGSPADATERVATGRGKELMDAVRRQVREMTEAEQLQLEQRVRRAETTSWQTQALVLFGNAFAFALLASGTLVIARELDRRRCLERSYAVAGEQQRLRDEVGRTRLGLRAVLDEMALGVALVELPSGTLLLDNAWLRARCPTLSEPGAAEAGPRFLRADGRPFEPGREPVARVRDGSAVRGETVRLACARTSLEVVVNVSPVREPDGRVVGAVVTCQDARELRQLEEKQQRAEDFRDVFLSALGHDLRNPLTVITAGASSLARRSDSEEQNRVLARMISSAERMGRMVDQLIELARARLGAGLAIERHGTDLGQLVREVVERREVLHPERAFEVEIQGGLTGSWDPQELEHVVDELVLNAVEHGRAGSPVRIAALGLGDEAVVEVYNEGEPIPPELLSLIFDPFRRAAERKRMRSSGLGLGLYLADQVVRAHGGRLEVESSEEAGTTFRMTLPRDEG